MLDARFVFKLLLMSVSDCSLKHEGHFTDFTEIMKSQSSSSIAGSAANVTGGMGVGGLRKLELEMEILDADGAGQSSFSLSSAITLNY